MISAWSVMNTAILRATSSLGAAPRLTVNRPGFDAASFLEKDADHAQQVPRRAAGARDPDGS
jgi:hypothetical protein